MTVVVTGAAGFAGRWLCRALEASGAPVVAWTHRQHAAPPAARQRVVDLVDPDAVQRALAQDQPHTVYHLAAVTNPRAAARDPDRAHAVNVQGTAHLFDALPPAARGVYVSTCHVYGVPEELPVPAHAVPRPRGAYATTKLLGERAALCHPNTVVARAFHHTGPGQSTDYVLADWADQVARGERTLRVGDLTVRRDFLDVRDVVAAYRVLAAAAPAGAVVQVCRGRSEALATYLDWILDGDDIAVEVDTARLRPAEVPDLVGDPAALRALGWEPRWPLRETLRRLRRGRRADG